MIIKPIEALQSLKKYLENATKKSSTSKLGYCKKNDIILKLMLINYYIYKFNLNLLSRNYTQKNWKQKMLEEQFDRSKLFCRDDQTVTTEQKVPPRVGSIHSDPGRIGIRGGEYYGK